MAEFLNEKGKSCDGEVYVEDNMETKTVEIYLRKTGSPLPSVIVYLSREEARLIRDSLSIVLGGCDCERW